MNNTSSGYDEASTKMRECRALADEFTKRRKKRKALKHSDTKPVTESEVRLAGPARPSAHPFPARPPRPPFPHLQHCLLWSFCAPFSVIGLRMTIVASRL